MSYFSGEKLRRLRQQNRLSITDVHDLTGISRAQISKIENGKCDPRLSTVTQLLSCYGAALGDLEPATPRVITLDEMKERSKRAAEVLEQVGLGESDPQARLDRKAARGTNIGDERRALATRS